MRILPLACESLGTRSMATFVETEDVKILIDPGVALGPSRYNLKPHPSEYKKQIEQWSLIERKAKEADIIILTHYHYDHYNPDKPEIFKEKIALIKDPQNKINKSQRRRARFFLSEIKKYVSELKIADDQEFQFGDTKIKFSEPTFHGPDGRMGWIIQIMIDDKKDRLVFSSDVEGPALDYQVNFILENNPNVVIVDGPLSYLLRYSYKEENLKKSLENLEKILKLKSVKTLILDHHFMRDIDWDIRIAKLFTIAKNNDSKIMPACRYIGEPLTNLEARRKVLWNKSTS
jgi:predicted metallo-beta-lactamase superfamily hydrolase